MKVIPLIMFMVICGLGITILIQADLSNEIKGFIITFLGIAIALLLRNLIMSVKTTLDM